MRNQKGLAPIIIIAVLAALSLATAGGVYFYQNYNSSGGTNIFQHKIKLDDNQQADYNKALEDNSDIGALIEHAKGAGLDSDALGQLTDAVIEQRKKEIQGKAAAILAKNSCDARMIDIEEALKLAEQAWLATDETTGDALWQWAREAFRGFVVDAAMAEGATFLETDIDLFSLSYEERKELYRQARETFYNRALLSQQAQLFGFEDIHQKILAGEFLEPVCVQLWNVRVESRFDAGDGFSYEEHWKNGAYLEDVPIYKYHPQMGFPIFEKQTSQEGYIDLEEMWFDDDTVNAPYHSEFRGTVFWEIHMKYEDDPDDFWNDMVSISAGIDQYRTTYGKTQEPQLRTPGYEDEWGPFRDIWYYDDIKVKVPALLLWKRQPFQHEEVLEDGSGALNEKATVKIEFTPSKRVKVQDVRF